VVMRVMMRVVVECRQVVVSVVLYESQALRRHCPRRSLRRLISAVHPVVAGAVACVRIAHIHRVGSGKKGGVRRRRS